MWVAGWEIMKFGDEKKPGRRKAVALRYDQQKDAAPRVVAKGTGVVAENMLTVAAHHGVPVYRQPTLVQSLMQLELDQMIPVELYQVVAEVLAYVYRLDQRAAKNLHHNNRARGGGGDDLWEKMR